MAKLNKKNTPKKDQTKKKPVTGKAINKKNKEKNDGRLIRYAVVGLGNIAQKAVLPAFKHAHNNSELVALVSGDKEKLQKVGKIVGVDAHYSYEDLERCIEVEKIDAVYIAVPNSVHYELTIRSLRAGAHVLCEKPLGISVEECESMESTASENGVYLMTAYRLHFDEANMELVKQIKEGTIGNPKIFNSVFSFQIVDENVRLESELGGGSLFDLGVYPINAARYVFQDEPIAVMGRSFYDDERFSEVDGTTTATLIFPKNRIAQFISSFAAANSGELQVVGEKGRIILKNAYDYAEDREMLIEVGNKKNRLKFKIHDQFAAELSYFSDCILNRKQPEPSAKEGKADLKVIEAIKESSEIGELVYLNSKEQVRYPDERQVITFPPIKKAVPLINSTSPTAE